MARKTVMIVVDDVDGQQLQDFETVRWSLDGKNYEFDTSAENAAAFREHVEQYRRLSRRVKSGARPASQTKGVVNGHSVAVVRAWALDNGYQVSDRGRIPAEVVQAYEQTLA